MELKETYKKMLEEYGETASTLKEKKKEVKEEKSYFGVEVSEEFLDKKYVITNSESDDIAYGINQISKYIGEKLPSPKYIQKHKTEKRKCSACQFFKKMNDGETICTNEKLSFDNISGTVTSNVMFKFDNNEHRFLKRSANQTICRHYIKKINKKSSEKVNDKLKKIDEWFNHLGIKHEYIDSDPEYISIFDNRANRRFSIYSSKFFGKADEEYIYLRRGSLKSIQKVWVDQPFESIKYEILHYFPMSFTQRK